MEHTLPTNLAENRAWLRSDEGSTDAYLRWKACGKKYEPVAAHFGVHYNTVRSAVKRGQALVEGGELKAS